MKNNIDKFINKIEAVTGKNRQSCGDGYKLWCPADHHNSASVTVSEHSDGTPLIHCHGGCSNEAILESVGWRWQDFGPVTKKQQHPTTPSSLSVSSLENFSSQRHLESRTLEEAWRVRYEDMYGRPALRYPTSLEVDRLKFLDKGTPKYRWAEKGKGKAHWYGLEKAISIGGPILYIVNGEPSVWACYQEGVPAVCPCGEATKPDKEMIKKLADSGFSSIKIVFDRDNAGRKGAKSLEESLRKSGLEAIALELPETLGDKADVDDLHRIHGKNLPQALESLSLLKTKKNQGPKLVPFSEIQSRNVEWIWDPYVGEGNVTLFAGNAGTGKTWAALELCSRLTQKGKYVIYGSAEDSWDITLKPRAEKLQCDLSKVIALQGKYDAEGNLIPMTMEDIRDFEIAITQYRPALIVIDPVSSWISDKIDMNKANKVRSQLAPLIRLSDKYGVAIILIHHHNKSVGDNALNKISGSADFVAAARSVLQFGVTRTNIQVVVHTKSNLSRKGKSLTYSLDNDGFAWTGESEITESDLCSGGPDFGEHCALEEATSWLKDELAHGPQQAGPLLRRFEDVVGYSRKTLQRAKTSLKVTTKKEGFGTSGRWMWTLPEHANNSKDSGILERKYASQSSMEGLFFKEDTMSCSELLEEGPDMPITEEVIGQDVLKAETIIYS